MLQKSILLITLVLAMPFFSFRATAFTGADSMQVVRLARSIDTLRDFLKATIVAQRKDDSVSAQSNRASFWRAVDEWNKDGRKHYAKDKVWGDFNWIISICLIVVLCWFIFFGRDYAILKDESFNIDTAGTKTLKPAADRPYSYSKVQCLYWTLIIFSCYLSACIYFKQLMPLNETAIILLGGGLAVSVFGKTIDNKQITENGSVPRHQDSDNKAGFFTDILSDDTGVSVHRLQGFLFNIVFGIGYILIAINTVAGKEKFPLPDFEMWQFTLLGVSAAGYLGMKAGENPDATKPARMALARARANV